MSAKWNSIVERSLTESGCHHGRDSGHGWWMQHTQLNQGQRIQEFQRGDLSKLPRPQQSDTMWHQRSPILHRGDDTNLDGLISPTCESHVKMHLLHKRTLMLCGRSRQPARRQKLHWVRVTKLCMSLSGAWSYNRDIDSGDYSPANTLPDWWADKRMDEWKHSPSTGELINWFDFNVMMEWFLALL